jgi:tetratricopeptide (TPR) repeat protein
VKIPPKSEYQYKKDYEEVQLIMKEADAAKREASMQAFIKAHPESRMVPTVAANLIYPHVQKQDWPKVIAMATEYRQLAPDDPGLMNTLINAYYRSGNTAKAGEIADELYKANPTKETAAGMAQLYLQMKNTDKYMVYAEKVVAEFPIEQSYPTLLQMAQIHIQKQEIPKAIECLNKVMGTYGSAVPPNVKEEEWNKTRAFAYGLMAADAYAKKDCAKTAELYAKVTAHAPKTADAYYYTGMCKWKDNDQAGAVPFFARAAVLNQNISPKAKEYLEQLWKAQHNGSLDGLDQVLAQAKSELGVS